MTKKTIEIFRAGTHTAMDGKSYTFTKADLQATAAAYDPAVFSAPAVIGHPKHDDPAYGWATALRVEGDVLLADMDQVNPAFAEIVNAGSYKKVSPWFYSPGAKNNPVPGCYYPRHIGFLGAAAPGCQGLAPVAFAEGDDAELIAFASDEELRPIVWLARLVGRLVRRQRDQVLADEGVEAADRAFPEYEVESALDIAAQLNEALKPEFRTAFAEGGPLNVVAEVDAAAAAELVRREEAVAARETQAAARDAAFAEGQREERRTEDAAFLEGLVNAGRLAPGFKDQMAVFCELLGDNDAIAFAEGQDAQDPRTAFKALLNDHLGVAIRLDEVAGAEGLRFAEGGTVDDHAAAIDSEMAAAKAAGHPISAAEASRRAKTRR